MPRLFTCIWLPTDIKREAIKFQDKMKKLPIKAKFIEPDNIHITITFIGDVKIDEIDDLIRNIDSTTKNIKKFKIRLAGLKLIPNENFLRVIGIDIENNENLRNLIKNIGNCIKSKFYESTKLTLCRVKNVSDKETIKKFIKENKNIEIGSFEIKEISLVESVLGEKGPTYKTLHKFKLL